MTQEKKEPPHAVSNGGASAAPDGGWGWMCVVGAAMIHIVFGTTVRAFGVLFLEFMKRYHGTATATGIGWLGAVNMTLTGLFGPLSAALCGRYGCRIVTIVGGLISTVGVIGTGFAPNLAVAYVTFGLLGGFGLSLCYTPAFIIIGEYFNKRKAMAMALAAFANGLGALIFPPLIVMWFNDYGFEGTFLILGGVNLHVCLGGMLFRPLPKKKINTYIKQKSIDDITLEKKANGKVTIEEETKVEKNENENNSNGNENGKSTGDDTYITENEKAEDECTKSILGEGESEKKTVDHKTDEKPSAPKPRMFDPKLLIDIKFMSLFFVLLNVMMVLSLSSGFTPALAVEEGVSEKQSAFLLSIAGIADTVGTLGIGLILDMSRIRPHRLHIYNILAAMCGITMLLNPLCDSFVTFAIAIAVRGAAAGVVMSQRATIVADIVERSKVPSAFGLLMVAAAIGGLIGRGLGGTLRDATGTYGTTFYLSGAMTMLGSVVFLVVTLRCIRPHQPQLQNTEHENNSPIYRPKPDANGHSGKTETVQRRPSYQSMEDIEKASAS